MAPQSANRWLRKLLGPGLALSGLVLALLGPAPAWGQEIHYLNRTSFVIPFNIDPAQQASIKQVILWYSDNRRDYQSAGQSVPTAKGFQFTVSRQGTYYFVVQAEYNTGQRVPPDPRAVNPALQVVVDTLPPVIATFRQIQPRDGTLGVEWDVRDDNPDFRSLRLDYCPAGTESWAPVNIGTQLYVGQFSWTPSTPASQYDVRLWVRDMAGNPVERKLRVSPGQFQQSAASPGASPPPQSRTMMVNTRTLRLNYDLFDIGKANIKTIEVWVTQDAQTWKKLAEQPPAVPPAPPSITVQVPADGRWGFKLIAKSEVGRGEPNPDRGTQPDNWVEVDQNPPKVKLLATDVTGGADNGQMTIRWTVEEHHLPDRPITLYYSTDKTNWNPIASGLPNNGTYTWPIPPELPHHSAWIKVEAVDLAGNVGSDRSPDEKPVVTDLAVPKVRIKNVDIVPGGPPAPGMPMSAAPYSQGILPVTGIEPVAPNPTPPPGAPPLSAPAPTYPPPTGTFPAVTPGAPASSPPPPGLIPPH